MADIVLTVTIPDAKVAPAKVLWEFSEFDGEVQSGAVIKTSIEAFMKQALIQKFLDARRNKALAENLIGEYDPF